MSLLPADLVSPWTLALLIGTAFTAGTIDAIAGGGGLLVLPALLHAGLQPHIALGTNKGQSVWGSASAMAQFWRRGMIDRRRALPGFVAAFAGSTLGVEAVLHVSPTALRPLACRHCATQLASGRLAPLVDGLACAFEFPSRLGLVKDIALALVVESGLAATGFKAGQASSRVAAVFLALGGFRGFFLVFLGRFSLLRPAFAEFQLLFRYGLWATGLRGRSTSP